MSLGLQLQVTLQKDEKVREVNNGVSIILFMYKIFIHCLLERSSCVLKMSFGLLCLWLPGNRDDNAS